jgi:REP element-mobilizing transposase RayT
MAIPYRGSTGPGTYFITASAFQKKSLFQSHRMASLLIDVLLHYQTQGEYHLHEFVIMPNHFHLLITPIPPVTIERAIQFIKGGFSSSVKFGNPAFMIIGYAIQLSTPAFAITFTSIQSDVDW